MSFHRFRNSRTTLIQSVVSDTNMVSWGIAFATALTELALCSAWKKRYVCFEMSPATLASEPKKKSAIGLFWVPRGCQLQKSTALRWLCSQTVAKGWFQPLVSTNHTPTENKRRQYLLQREMLFLAYQGGIVEDRADHKIHLENIINLNQSSTLEWYMPITPGAKWLEAFISGYQGVKT